MNSEIPSNESSPACPYLRSKEMFYEEPGAGPTTDNGGAFWCSRTQEAFGPDGKAAETSTCRPGRSCFRS